MPQRKKDPSARARANKASTAATLPRTVPSTAPEDYSGMTVAGLRAEIDRLNEGRSEDFQLPKRGSKADLIAVLTIASSPVPEIPERVGGWHPVPLKWWHEAWTSPMSVEWHPETDYFNVYLCARIMHMIETATSPTIELKAMAELRPHRADLGLAPYPRRRLEWTIESADEAKTRGEQRRSTGRPPAPSGASAGPDPRAGLHAVK